jgi:hypothetical protein
MEIRIQCVVIDAHDLEREARFRAEGMGWRITLQGDEEWAVEPPEGSPAVDVAPGLPPVRGPDEKVTKNRLHLDLAPRSEA